MYQVPPWHFVPGTRILLLYIVLEVSRAQRITFARSFTHRFRESKQYRVYAFDKLMSSSGIGWVYYCCASDEPCPCLRSASKIISPQDRAVERTACVHTMVAHHCVAVATR